MEEVSSRNVAQFDIDLVHQKFGKVLSGKDAELREIAESDLTNQGNLLQFQHVMSDWNATLTLTTTMTKSLSDMTKQIIQNMG